VKAQPRRGKKIATIKSAMAANRKARLGGCSILIPAGRE
jgi:hypothetical protein